MLRLALLAHGLFVLVCELYSVHYFSLFLSYKVRTMTDVESTKCGGRALVVGHGFVKRLVRVVRSGERKIRRHDSTQLNSTGDYGRRCLTPLCPHH